MRDIYISVESLRNSADLLSSRINSWVCERLRWADGRDPQWGLQRRMLLEGLDVEPELIDILLSLELAWEDGHLWVRSGAQAQREKTFQNHRVFCEFRNL